MKEGPGLSLLGSSLSIPIIKHNSRWDHIYFALFSHRLTFQSMGKRKSERCKLLSRRRISTSGYTTVKSHFIDQPLKTSTVKMNNTDHFGYSALFCCETLHPGIHADAIGHKPSAQSWFVSSSVHCADQAPPHMGKLPLALCILNYMTYIICWICSCYVWFVCFHSTRQDETTKVCFTCLTSNSWNHCITNRIIKLVITCMCYCRGFQLPPYEYGAEMRQNGQVIAKKKIRDESKC